MMLLNQKKAGIFLFLVLLLAMSWYFGYPRILPMRPQSVHAWRQTDCLSFARNYYDHGMRFFQPAMHNLQSDGETTGKAAWEFPLIYYLVAGIWKITGVHEWIFRLVVFLVFGWGLYSLYRLLAGLTGFEVGSVPLALLLAGSPVLAYYALNFLPNVPALGLVFVSWYQLYRYLKRSKTSGLVLWILAGSLAALLKVTALISFIAFGGVVLLNLAFRWHKRIHAESVRLLGGLVLIGTLALAWFRYAQMYNAIHWGDYGLIPNWSIWDMDRERIAVVWRQVKNLWFPEYFHPWVIWLSGMVAAWVLLTPRRSGWMVWWFYLLSLLVSLFYTFLFFNAFHDHDYYLVNVFFLIPLTWGILLYQVRGLGRKVYVPLQLIPAVLLVLSAIHTRRHLAERYEGWWNTDHRKNLAVYEDLEALNRSLGIDPDDRVISVYDPSFNISLYLMNQPGWTNYGHPFRTGEEVESLLEKGAKYLFVNTNTLPDDSVFRPFIRDSLAAVPPLKIYSLKPAGL